MRVASSTFSNNLVRQIQTLTQRQSLLQSQVATGQKLQSPSDNPAAVHRVMNLTSEQARLAQYQSNISSLREVAETNYSAMKGLQTISDRAGEIATLADGVKSPEELRAYATEITQLIQQGVQVMNRKLRGDYIFGGTENQQAPYDMTLDANGNVTGVTYQGNQTVRDTEIGEGDIFTVQAVGENNSGTGTRGLITDSRAGADFFNHLIDLQNHLLAGDTNAIASTDLDNLAADEDNLAYNLGTNGAMQARLDAASELASRHGESIDGLISSEADADMAETMVKLNQSNTAYMAALQSASSLMKTSLLDYL